MFLARVNKHKWSIKWQFTLYLVWTHHKQVFPDIHLPRNVFQLPLGAFPVQMRYVIPPESSGSTLGSPPSCICQENLQRNVFRRHPNQTTSAGSLQRRGAADPLQTPAGCPSSLWRFPSFRVNPSYPPPLQTTPLWQVIQDDTCTHHKTEKQLIPQCTHAHIEFWMILNYFSSLCITSLFFPSLPTPHDHRWALEQRTESASGGC